MEYTIQKLAKIAGISTRTLRYYDQIGLLNPARMNSSGYRIYGQNEVDLLQQILFYKELGVNLEDIKRMIKDPSFDTRKALMEHKEKLLRKRAQINQLIENVTSTLDASERGIAMSDNKKFEGFKQNMIDENEKNYGKEVRKKYGDKQVDQSNKKIKGMTEEQYNQIEALTAEVQDTLAEAYKTGDPTSELAQKAADLHRQWISFYWDSYSKEAHAGLAQMYVDDERFTAYYDKNQPGTAAFLRDAVLIYTGMK